MGARDVDELFKCCCTEREECKDFQKVADIKDVGLVIFRHIINNDNVDDQTEVLQSAVSPVEEVFIFQNIRNVDLPPANFVPILESFKISCLRCRKMYERAQKLLKKVPIIGEKHVVGICDHCYQKQFPKSCYECEKIVDKFLAARYGEKYTKDALSTWLSKMKNLLRNVTGDEVKTAKAASRANSDLCINKLSRLESKFTEMHKEKANVVLIPGMSQSDTNIPVSLLYNSKHAKFENIQERLNIPGNSSEFLIIAKRRHADQLYFEFGRPAHGGFGIRESRSIFDKTETIKKDQMHDSFIVKTLFDNSKNVKDKYFEGPLHELRKSVDFKDSMKQSAFEDRKVHSLLDDDSSIHPLPAKVPDKTSTLKRKKVFPKERSDTLVARDVQGLKIAGQQSTKSIIKKTIPINTRERKHPSKKSLLTTISKATHHTLGKELSYFFPLGDVPKETPKLKGKANSAALILETQKKMEEKKLRKETEKKIELERKKTLAEEKAKRVAEKQRLAEEKAKFAAEKQRLSEEKRRLPQDEKKRHAEEKDTKRRTKEDEKSNNLLNAKIPNNTRHIGNRKSDMGQSDLRVEKEGKKRQKELQETEKYKAKQEKEEDKEILKMGKDTKKKEKEEQLRMEKEDKQGQKQLQGAEKYKAKQEKEEDKEILKMGKDTLKKEKEEQLRLEKEDKQGQKQLQGAEIYKAKQKKEAKAYEQNKSTKYVKNEKQIGEQTKDVQSTQNEKLAQIKLKQEKEGEKEISKIEKDMLKREKEEQVHTEKEEKQRQKELKEVEIYKSQQEKELKAYEQNKLTQDFKNKKKIADQTKDVKSTQNEKENEKLAQMKLKQEKEEEKEMLKIEKDMLKQGKEERLHTEKEEKQRQKELKEVEIYKAKQEKEAKAYEQNKLTKDVKNKNKIADQTKDVKSTQNEEEKEKEKLAREKLKQEKEEAKEMLKIEKDMLKQGKEERLRMEQEEKQRQKELKEAEMYKAKQEEGYFKSTNNEESLALKKIMEHQLSKMRMLLEAENKKNKEVTDKDATLNTIDVKMEHNVKKDRASHKIEAHEVDSFIIKEHCKHSQDPFTKQCIICLDSELELNIENLLREKLIERKLSNVIVGEKIFKFTPALWGKTEEQVLQSVTTVDSIHDHTNITPKPPPPSEVLAKSKSGKLVQDPELTKGIIKYALSDRTFIDKGWTMLPTEKVVRKMNVYRMRPAQPQFDWFEHNKKKRLMLYDSGERLAEFDENGRGRWYYRNGHLALDYYNAEEVNAHQRFVLYSSGEPDERGRSRPIAILATFDYMGNGVVFDHSGKIRLKYNQTEGVVLDRGIGPVSHWKWHTLNDPPVLQQVMIDTQMSHKDPEILKLSVPSDNNPRPDNEEMLAIEFDNFVKEKSKKLSQTFQPFQIKMKALKINEHFSLKVLDQATVYLIYRDGTTNLQINIGMILDHKEIVDTDTAEVGEVSNSLERFPARTESIARMQRSVAYAQRYERSRTERERRLRPTQPTASVDVMAAAASRPLRTPLRTGPAADTTYSSNVRKPSSCTVYYNSRFT